ncbi:MAG: hypothetical protein II724_05140 [Clostridia bacterium]|nr:hypothetical protein [Clostridia bacterium]
MSTFKNQAALSYNGATTVSNTVTGEITGVLTAAKNSLADCYFANSRLTYIISLINSGDAALTDVTVTDDLGEFELGDASFTPLSYVEGSAACFVDGVLSAPPAVSAADGLIFSGLTVPANGNTLIVYEAEANGYAPLDAGSCITNTASVTGARIGSAVTASETVPAMSEAMLSIAKSLSPLSVNENGSLTYTFVIENTGSAPAEGDPGPVLSDTFDPVLTELTATLNGAALNEGEGYTYDEATGEFETMPGVLSIPAASYARGSDGSVTVTPGKAVLTVSGKLG